MSLKVLFCLAVLVSVCAPALAQTPKTEPVTAAGFVLAIDNSKSIAPYFPQILTLGRLLAEKKAQQEHVSIVRFVDSNRIDAVMDFTDDAAKLREAFDHLYTDLGHSAVLDAVFVAAEHASNRGKRTSVILISDGEDRASFYKAEHVYSKLREHGVRVFTVGLVNRLGGKSRKRAVKLLSEIAEQSGGRAFFIESEAEIPGVANALLLLTRQS